MFRSSVQSPDLLLKLILGFPAYTGYKPRNSFARIVQGTWKQPSIPNRAGALQAHIGQVLRIAPYTITAMQFNNSDCYRLDDPTITVHIVSRYNIELDPFTDLPTGLETPVDVSTLPDPSEALLGNDYNSFSGFDNPPIGGFVPLVSLYENDAPGRHPGQTGDIIPTVWNLKAEVKANWVLADLFSSPIHADFKHGPPVFVNFSVTYGLTHNAPTASPPVPVTTSTVPIQAYVNETGEDPTFKIASRIGVLQNSPINQSVWEPTENETFHPEIDGGIWEDIIGWNLESSDTNPVPIGEDGVPTITSPTVSYVFGFGRQTYHVWTGDISKAAPDFVGYLIHTEDPKRKTFNPPAGLIYPFYTTARTF